MLQAPNHCPLCKSSLGFVSESLLSSTAIFGGGGEGSVLGDRGCVPAFDGKSFVADSATGRARGMVAGLELLI